MLFAGLFLDLFFCCRLDLVVGRYSILTIRESEQVNRSFLFHFVSVRALSVPYSYFYRLIDLKLLITTVSSCRPQTGTFLIACSTVVSTFQEDIISNVYALSISCMLNVWLLVLGTYRINPNSIELLGTASIDRAYILWSCLTQ
jgi:hypothetical protein